MRWLKAAALALGLLASAGCGFHPIYASPSDSASVGVETAQVKVDPIDYPGLQSQKLFRLGQELHNALVARLNPDGSPGKAAYTVKVILSESQSDIAIDPSGLSQRSSIQETATYKLISLDDGKVVMTGTSTGINGFGNVTNAFATVEGRNDARTRAVSYLAEDIATRVALYFRQKSAEKANP